MQKLVDFFLKADHIEIFIMKFLPSHECEYGKEHTAVLLGCIVNNRALLFKLFFNFKFDMWLVNEIKCTRSGATVMEKSVTTIEFP